ncbi:MAG: HD domain-containing protein [Sedimentisphaerales bacterium]|jgi:5'-deoxynucleotidase YfbR-like HD superfamily hydrolase
MDSELKETISLYKTACCLKNLPRQGWIQEGALAAEADSVAGHSFCVTLIAFMIAQVLKNRGHEINVDRVLAIAAFHDLPECATGEIASGVKNCMGSEADRIEEKLFVQLLNGLEVKDVFLGLVREFNAGETNEALVVKFADILDAHGHARDRLHKTFPKYLQRQCKKLKSKNTEIGSLLADWIEQTCRDYDKVSKREPWL